jgi:hypothetical protein
MHNLDPKDMDVLFREGADQHEFTYNPDAWAMMEEKLDKKDRRKYLLWFFLSFLLVGAVGTFFSINTSEQTSPLATASGIEIVNENPQAVVKEVANSTSEKAPEKLQTIEQNIDSKRVNNRTQNSASRARENTSTKSVIENQSSISNNSIQSENTGSLVKNKVVSISSKNAENIEYTDVVNDPPYNVITLISDTNTKSDMRDIVMLDVLEKESASALNSMDNKIEEINLRPSATLIPMITDARTRYVLTAFASSDLSSVGFFSDPQSGYTLGAKAGVQLADKFQFDLGFAYSLKRYGSEGEDYNIEGGWNTTGGVNPTWMDGKGNVLQIPLEASYYFNGYENNSFFINAGISSYFFNSEWYGFKYDPEDLLINPNAIEEITMDDISRRNFHLAGVARISVGYQKTLSSNMGVELSPYLQIPLTGIGEGRVDLYTTGIQLAIKFNTK